MSPHIHNRENNPPPTEGALLSKIETALDKALNEKGLESSQSSVKREKYVWLAVNEFSDDEENPITYSWFKWGISSLAGSGGASTSSTLVTKFPQAANLFQARPDDIKQYYLDENHKLPLEQYWEADFLDFLEQFYTHYGPEEYRKIYLTNIRLLKLFDDIEYALNFNRDPARQETYEEATDITRDIKKEVLRLESVEENYEYLNEFTILFEDVVMSLVDIDGDEIEKGHQTAFSELQDFYKDVVWLMVAHSLSLETAVGPNNDKIYTWSTSNLERLRGSFEDKLQTKKSICDSVGLLPDIEEYDSWETEDEEPSESGEEFDEIVEDFLAVVDGRATHE